MTHALAQHITQFDLLRVADEMVKDRKIQAIKELRSATNLGLKEAKDTIDKLDRSRLGKSSSTLAAELAEELDRSYRISSTVGEGAYSAPFVQVSGSADLTMVANLLQALLIEAKEQTALLKDFMEALE